jgi:hypothetical protein
VRHANYAGAYTPQSSEQGANVDLLSHRKGPTSGGKEPSMYVYLWALLIDKMNLIRSCRQFSDFSQSHRDWARLNWIHAFTLALFNSSLCILRLLKLTAPHLLSCLF